MELVIDRKTWLRGNTNSFLLRIDGMKCCLGFLSLACGLEESQIKNVTTPGVLKNSTTQRIDNIPESMNWLMGGVHWNSDDATNLMEINDARVGRKLFLIGSVGKETVLDSEETRERLITEIMAKHDVQVKFIN